MYSFLHTHVVFTTPKTHRRPSTGRKRVKKFKLQSLLQCTQRLKGTKREFMCKALKVNRLFNLLFTEFLKMVKNGPVGQVHSTFSPHKDPHKNSLGHHLKFRV